MNKLLSYIVKNPSSREEVKLVSLVNHLKRSTEKQPKLLCDFHSLLNWLLPQLDEGSVQHGKLSPYSCLYGGDMREYGRGVKDFVNALQAIGIQLIVFIEGPPGSSSSEFQAKFNLLKKNHMDTLEVFSSIQQVCERKKSFVQIPWYPTELVAMQIEMILRNADLTVFHCIGSITGAVVKYCNEHKEVLGVFSSDVNLAVIPCINLFHPLYFDVKDDLGVRCEQIRKDVRDITCEMISPEQLASCIGICVFQLIDLSILCGNEFTNEENCSFSLWARLGLSGSDVESVSSWLKQQKTSLMDSSEVAAICSEHPQCGESIKLSYLEGYSETLKPESLSPLKLFVYDGVLEGSLPRSFLSIVLKCVYWRPLVPELVTLEQSTICDLNLSLRKMLYAMLGLDKVTELGRIEGKSFFEKSVVVDFAICDSLHFLNSLREQSLLNRLALLFYLITTEEEFESTQEFLSFVNRSFLNVFDDDVVDVEVVTCLGVVVCASLLFMSLLSKRSKNAVSVKIGEIDALVAACLVCSASIPPCPVAHLPPARAIMISSWFSETMKEAYSLASLLGLSDFLPPPAEVFFSSVYVPFHVVAILPVDDDCESCDDVSLNLRSAAMFFNEIFSLSSVLAFRSAILDRGEYCSFLKLLNLFSLALEDVEDHKSSLLSSLTLLPAAIKESSKESNAVNLPCYNDSSAFGVDLESAVDDGENFELYSSDGHDESDVISDGLSDSPVHSSSSSAMNSSLLESSTSFDELIQTVHLDVSDHIAESEKLRKVPPVNAAKGLPVLEHRDKILELIRNHRVVIIEGETGCGKSTIVPQLILEDALTSSRSKDCKIIVTQPRRVAALRIAERVASERGETLGQTVGCLLGGERHMTSLTTALTYCTTGYLLQNLIHNPEKIRLYSHVILDEVHERSTEADFLMLVVRKLVSDIPDSKVVLMSATMQGSVLTQYFEHVFDESVVSMPYFVGSKHFPIQSFFIDEICNLILQNVATEDCWHHSQAKAATNLVNWSNSQPRQSLEQCLSLKPEVTCHTQKVCFELIISLSKLGDSILVFLPGMSEILSCFDFFTESLDSEGLSTYYDLFILHSQVTLDEQKAALVAPPENKIHVILATNIAESSVTIPNLCIVINFGIYRQMEYISKRRVSHLVKRWCSQASCAQREGRAGRVCEGIAVHLFSRQMYEVVIPTHDPPEMATAPLAKLVLQAKLVGSKLGILSPSKLLSLAIQPPSLQQIEVALQELGCVGAVASPPGRIVSEEAPITLLGHFCLSLPVDIHVARLVYLGVLFGCPVEAVVIAASLSCQDVFSLPSRLLLNRESEFHKKFKDSQESRFMFDGGTYSDPIMTCSVFQKWLSFKSECKNSFVKAKTVKKFCLKHALNWVRLLHLNSMMIEIALRTLPALDKHSLPFQKLLSLAALAKNSTRAMRLPSSPVFHQVSTLFVSNVDILKTLLVASYPNNLLVGFSEHNAMNSKQRNRAIQLLHCIEAFKMNPSQTLVMNGLVSVSEEDLIAVAKRVVPGCCCKAKMIDHTGFIEITKSSPEENVFQSSSVVSLTIPKEVCFFYQYGERKRFWSVSGTSVQLKPPTNPLVVSWCKMNTAEKEYAHVLTWRNRSGIVCELGPFSGPFFAVATTLQGSEYGRRVLVRGMTVLPSLWIGLRGVLMLLIFQPLGAVVDFKVNKKMKEVVAVRLNSVEVDFYSNSTSYFSLKAEDIITVNAIREKLSKALNNVTSDYIISTEVTSSMQGVLHQAMEKEHRYNLQERSGLLDAEWETALFIDNETGDEGESVDKGIKNSDSEKKSDTDSHSRRDKNDENCYSTDVTHYPPYQCSLIKVSSERKKQYKFSIFATPFVPARAAHVSQAFPRASTEPLSPRTTHGFTGTSASLPISPVSGNAILPQNEVQFVAHQDSRSISLPNSPIRRPSWHPPIFPVVHPPSLLTSTPRLPVQKRFIEKSRNPSTVHTSVPLLPLPKSGPNCHVAKGGASPVSSFTPATVAIPSAVSIQATRGLQMPCPPPSVNFSFVSRQPTLQVPSPSSFVPATVVDLSFQMPSPPTTVSIPSRSNIASRQSALQMPSPSSFVPATVTRQCSFPVPTPSSSVNLAPATLAIQNRSNPVSNQLASQMPNPRSFVPAAVVNSFQMPSPLPVPTTVSILSRSNIASRQSALQMPTPSSFVNCAPSAVDVPSPCGIPSQMPLSCEEHLVQCLKAYLCTRNGKATFSELNQFFFPNYCSKFSTNFGSLSWHFFIRRPEFDVYIPSATAEVFSPVDAVIELKSFKALPPPKSNDLSPVRVDTDSPSSKPPETEDTTESCVAGSSDNDSSIGSDECELRSLKIPSDVSISGESFATTVTDLSQLSERFLSEMGWLDLGDNEANALGPKLEQKKSDQCATGGDSSDEKQPIHANDHEDPELLFDFDEVEQQPPMSAKTGSSTVNSKVSAKLASIPVQELNAPLLNISESNFDLKTSTELELSEVSTSDRPTNLDTCEQKFDLTSAATTELQVVDGALLEKISQSPVQDASPLETLEAVVDPKSLDMATAPPELYLKPESDASLGISESAACHLSTASGDETQSSLVPYHLLPYDVRFKPGTKAHMVGYFSDYLVSRGGGCTVLDVNHHFSDRYIRLCTGVKTGCSADRASCHQLFRRVLISDPFFKWIGRRGDEFVELLGMHDKRMQPVRWHITANLISFFAKSQTLELSLAYLISMKKKLFDQEARLSVKLFKELHNFFVIEQKETDTVIILKKAVARRVEKFIPSLKKLLEPDKPHHFRFARPERKTRRAETHKAARADKLSAGRADLETHPASSGGQDQKSSTPSGSRQKYKAFRKSRKRKEVKLIQSKHAATPQPKPSMSPQPKPPTSPQPKPPTSPQPKPPTSP